MSDTSPNGMASIQTVVNQIATVLEQIPRKHRGICFDRTFATDETGRLELSFARVWASMNDESRCSPILRALLLLEDGDDSRRGDLPQSEREWDVAHFAAATVFQWLATPEGTAALCRAFEEVGGSLTWQLPEIEDGE